MDQAHSAFDSASLQILQLGGIILIVHSISCHFCFRDYKPLMGQNLSESGLDDTPSALFVYTDLGRRCNCLGSMTLKGQLSSLQVGKEEGQAA